MYHTHVMGLRELTAKCPELWDLQDAIPDILCLAEQTLCPSPVKPTKKKIGKPQSVVTRFLS